RIEPRERPGRDFSQCGRLRIAEGNAGCSIRQQLAKGDRCRRGSRRHDEYERGLRVDPRSSVESQSLLLEFLDFLNRLREKHIDRSSLFNLPAKRFRRTVHDVYRSTIFALEHRQDFVKCRLQTMGRPNRQGFSLNKLPGCNDTYDATYQSYRHTKFPNSRHGAPLSDPNRQRVLPEELLHEPELISRRDPEW